MKTIQFYCDPGHGWAKVPLKVIKKLGLINDISHFSYISKEHAFLEEDSDASKLIDAVRAHTNVEPKFKSSHGDKQSRIRNYCSYDPTKIDWNTCRVKGQ
jgi:hypothetical protein